ncbi:hypothetical protein AVEN_259755-1 [Araneus ventricosus]|uniref:Uncharacterized protein n=1 Tax=Araneus ventricosus TaxID=182803 RepID=A0A4Y2D510_ARAVE|nr:hypothetical protein AVEN_259755-1 [Araneus ventricosus]
MCERIGCKRYTEMQIFDVMSETFEMKLTVKTSIIVNSYIRYYCRWFGGDIDRKRSEVHNYGKDYDTCFSLCDNNDGDIVNEDDSVRRGFDQHVLSNLARDLGMPCTSSAKTA